MATRKKKRIQISAVRAAVFLSIICAVGALLLAVSVILSSKQAEKTSMETTQKPEQKNQIAPEFETPQSQIELQKPEQKSETKSKPEAVIEQKSNAFSVIPIEKPVIVASAKPESKVKKPIIIIVLDDAGHNMSQLQPFLELPFALTIAVLPRLEYSKQAADAARKAGKEVILHQPMQAKNLSINPGPGAILPDMTEAEIEKTVLHNIAELGVLSGINNHEGSLITENPDYMRIVLEVCKRKNLYFLDSKTTSKSVVRSVSAEKKMKIWERAVFLDNSQNRTDIENALKDGAKRAKKDGFAILIGHVKSGELALILREQYTILKKEGFEFSTVKGVGNNYANTWN